MLLKSVCPIKFGGSEVKSVKICRIVKCQWNSVFTQQVESLQVKSLKVESSKAVLQWIIIFCTNQIQNMCSKVKSVWTENQIITCLIITNQVVLKYQVTISVVQKND